MSTGRAFPADPEPTGYQGDIIIHHNDAGRGDVKVGGKLQNTAAGQIHIGLGLQKHELPALIIDLSVKTLEFHFVDPAAKGICQNVNGTEACIVAGFFIFTAWIAQTDDQPSFIHFVSQSLNPYIQAQISPNIVYHK